MLFDLLQLAIDNAKSLYPKCQKLGRAKVEYLLAKRDDGSDITCVLLMIPEDAEVPEHLHEDNVSIIYPLSGNSRQ